MEGIRPTSLKPPTSNLPEFIGTLRQQVTRTPVPSKRANREFTVRYKGVSEKSRAGTAWTSGYRTRKKLSPFLPFSQLCLLFFTVSASPIHVAEFSHPQIKSTCWLPATQISWLYFLLVLVIDRQQRELYDLLVSWLALAWFAHEGIVTRYGNGCWGPWLAKKERNRQFPE